MSDTATGTRALDRAADLVALVVHADEPMSFADLQDASGLAKSTTSRMLTALERSGLLERDATGSYVAGRLFWLYAARHDPWEEMVRLADPVMQRIGEETGETVHLSVARGDRVVQVAQVDSTYLLGTRDWTEVDVPAHCSALGKVFLAWDALALADGELEIGLTGVAVPVFGTHGDVVASLGISGPTQRLEDRLDELGRHLLDQSTALSSLLRGPAHRNVRTEEVVA